jgi:cytochrome c oxidase cbb3-type subunit III
VTALAGLCRRVMLPRARGALAMVIGALLPGCEWMPGKPTAADAWQSPHSVVDFEKLYLENCRGCHGTKNEPAGAITLDNPTYIAVVPRETLRSIITNGVPGSSMIAFSEEHGGPLTEKQIEVLVEGITAWGAKNPPSGPLPAYSGPLGDVAQGATAFATFCASCHGADGTGGDKAGSVVHPAYVGLVSDQYLRTIVIAGRNDLGCPDFQNRVPGKAMSEEEISGVVAWLVSHRRNEFGQPLPLTQR